MLIHSLPSLEPGFENDLKLEPSLGVFVLGNLTSDAAGLLLVLDATERYVSLDDGSLIGSPSSNKTKKLKCFPEAMCRKLVGQAPLHLDLVRVDVASVQVICSRLVLACPFRLHVGCRDCFHHRNVH